jgi:hypothetical protein
MKDVIFLIFHLLTTTAKLLQPGGSRAITAEYLLLLSNPIHRAPPQSLALCGKVSLGITHPCPGYFAHTKQAVTTGAGYFAGVHPTNLGQAILWNPAAFRATASEAIADG